MHQLSYAVTKQDGAWTIRFGGRSFDRFASKTEALSRALQWAREAPRREAITITVAVEDEDGGTNIVDPDQG